MEEILGWRTSFDVKEPSEDDKPLVEDDLQLKKDFQVQLLLEYYFLSNITYTYHHEIKEKTENHATVLNFKTDGPIFVPLTVVYLLMISAHDLI